MLNFKGGLIKHGNDYIPTSSILRIGKNYNRSNSSCVTLKEQENGVITENFVGSPDVWANAYLKADNTNSIVDIFA